MGNEIIDFSMTMKKKVLLTMLTLTLLSCKTTAPVDPVPEQQNTPPVEQVETPPAETTAEPAETSAEEVYQVSEEKYNQTFGEIERLIKEITQLIRKKNFNGWQKFLSEKYIEKVGSAEYLREVSDSPSLKDVVELKTLRDYFQWVVVPSRASARLDEIVFKDETHVTAYMYIEDNPTILFQFELIDGAWAVTIW